MRVDSPGLDVGDGLLDHLADPADALILLFGGFAQFAVGGLLVRGDHSLADVSLVGDPSGGVDSVEQSGGVQGGHVVHGPRVGVGGPHQAPAGQDQDLDVHAGRPVLARPQFAVIPPAPAGEEGAVHHVVAALGHLLRSEQHVLQGPDDRIGQGPDGPRDRGLGHTQLLADHHLHHIEPFSPEPMAQGPGSARWCGKDGCGVAVVRTGAAHLALPRTFPRHHADPGQPRGLPGEKGSLWRM